MHLFTSDVADEVARDGSRRSPQIPGSEPGKASGGPKYERLLWRSSEKLHELVCRVISQ
jgi:hypothetical protein